MEGYVRLIAKVRDIHLNKNRKKMLFKKLQNQFILISVHICLYVYQNRNKDEYILIYRVIHNILNEQEQVERKCVFYATIPIIK